MEDIHAIGPSINLIEGEISKFYSNISINEVKEYVSKNVEYSLLPKVEDVTLLSGDYISLTFYIGKGLDGINNKTFIVDIVRDNFNVLPLYGTDITKGLISPLEFNKHGYGFLNLDLKSKFQIISKKSRENAKIYSINELKLTYEKTMKIIQNKDTIPTYLCCIGYLYLYLYINSKIFGIISDEFYNGVHQIYDENSDLNQYINQLLKQIDKLYHDLEKQIINL